MKKGINFGRNEFIKQVHIGAKESIEEENKRNGSNYSLEDIIDEDDELEDEDEKEDDDLEDEYNKKIEEIILRKNRKKLQKRFQSIYSTTVKITGFGTKVTRGLFKIYGVINGLITGAIAIAYASPLILGLLGCVVLVIFAVGGFMAIFQSQDSDSMNNCGGSGCVIEATNFGNAILLSTYKDGYFIPIGSPVEGTITQYENDRQDFYEKIGLKQGHNGVDIAGNEGKPVYSLGNGHVEYSYNATNLPANINKDYGCMAKVYYDGLDGKQTVCYYGHMQKEVCEGKPLLEKMQVSSFAEIGKVGNTGNSSGPHLHYECRINNSKIYSLTTSTYLGLSIPGKSADQSKKPTIGLGIPATPTSGLEYMKNKIGGGSSDTQLYKDTERKMGEWYSYLNSRTVVKENNIDPLKVMAFLYRERTSFLMDNDLSAGVPANKVWNPFQIGTNAGNQKRASIQGCEDEREGDFENELDCFIKTTAIKTQGYTDKYPSKTQSGAYLNALDYDIPLYYFAETVFAYNGTLESSYRQEKYCAGTKYNQNIRFGRSSDLGGVVAGVKYTGDSCGSSGFGYKANIASRDFWYSSYVMNGIGLPFSVMPFRGNSSDDKLGVISFYTLLNYWRAESFIPAIRQENGEIDDSGIF